MSTNDANNWATCLNLLLQDSLNLRKINLIGCKMKIYQESMRNTSFLSILENFKKEDFLCPDRNKAMLEKSEIIC